MKVGLHKRSEESVPCISLTGSLDRERLSGDQVRGPSLKRELHVLEQVEALIM